MAHQPLPGKAAGPPPPILPKHAPPTVPGRRTSSPPSSAVKPPVSDANETSSSPFQEEERRDLSSYPDPSSKTPEGDSTGLLNSSSSSSRSPVEDLSPQRDRQAPTSSKRMKAEDEDDNDTVSRREGRGGSGCFSGLKSLLPRSDLPGARQKTPLGLNRYIILCIYVFIGFTTSAVFYGWTALSAMMFKTEAFSYLCLRDPVTGVYTPDLREEEGRLYICDDQDVAVQKLYTITFAVCCTMSACAGTLLDWLGPLYTGILGQCFNLLGWMLFAFSSAEYSAYYAALIFIGSGADTGFLPTLCIRRLFPGSTGLIITILGSAASASFGIPLILNGLVETYDLSVRTVSLIYCGFGPILALLLELLFMPRKGFSLDDEGKIFKDTDRTEEEEDLASELRNPNHETRLRIHGEGEQGDKELRDSSFSSPSNQQQQQEQAHGDPLSPSCNEASRVSGVKKRFGVFYGHVKTSSFWRQFFSLRYFLICLYFVVVSWSSAYFQQAARRMFTSEVISVLEILLPLSFIPCIILGKLADLIGILKVLVIVNTFGVLMYSFSFPKMIDATGYISSISFVMYISLFTSQVFVYIESTFSPNHFGKLIGIASMIGGLSSLVTNALYEDVTVKKNDGDPLVIQIVMTVLLCLQYVWILILGILKMRNPSPYTKAFPSRPPAGTSTRGDPSSGTGHDGGALEKVVALQGDEEEDEKKKIMMRGDTDENKEGAHLSHHLSTQLTSPSNPSFEQTA
ncbi:transporter [Cystoisospora suis]|uniref:Transporter n=1 Tax=Cystoisospora suis TaxID=483139 RepID=A0A2C6L715_9APIC|nr:transporter [Cystoisospora suis]